MNQFWLLQGLTELGQPIQDMSLVQSVALPDEYPFDIGYPADDQARNTILTKT